MDESSFIALLEDVRARCERGESVDLEAYRLRLGGDWERFRNLVSFDRAFSQVLEPSGVGDMPQVFGDYTLLRELGRGAFGIVYEAYDEKLGRQVALKTLRPELEANQKFRQRYEREARSCAQVRHPHLVEIYDWGEVDGRMYYAMPLLTGGPLSDFIREKRLPPIAETCRCMADVASAVGAMHDAHIVHRDVKPANIVVEGDGRFVLADFGLARRIDLPALTRTGQRMGTPQYMSPEQLAGNRGDVDARTDVYALGATLYETLSGRCPFEVANIEALYRRVLHERPTLLEKVARDVTPDMSRVVMKCLETRPEDRYASGHELAAELRAAAAGDPVRARPSSRLQHLARRIRRPRLAAALVVLGCIALAFLFVRLGGPRARGEAGLVFELSEEGHVDRDVIKDLVRWAADNGVHVTIKLGSTTTERHGVDIAPVQLVFPRGRVRPQDLDGLRVDVSEAFEGRGSLVFRRGEEVLATLAFEPGDYRNRIALPQAVRDAALPGVTLTWSFEPRRGSPIEATFEVVDADLDGAFTRIDVLTVVPGQAAAVSHLLRGLVLLEHGLGVAAYRELVPLRATPVGEDSEPAVRLQVEALRMAYGDDVIGLQSADVWHELMLRLDALDRR